MKLVEALAAANIQVAMHMIPQACNFHPAERLAQPWIPASVEGAMHLDYFAMLEDARQEALVPGSLGGGVAGAFESAECGRASTEELDDIGCCIIPEAPRSSLAR